MEKLVIILTCMLICLSLFSGCTNQKNDTNQEQSLGNSVEIDDMDFETGTEAKSDAEDNSSSITLPDGITYDFKDPENAEGIVVTPRE